MHTTTAAAASTSATSDFLGLPHQRLPSIDLDAGFDPAQVMRCIWADSACEEIVAAAYARGQWAGMALALKQGFSPIEYEQRRFRLHAKNWFARL